jgi:hemoglobin
MSEVIIIREIQKPKDVQWIVNTFFKKVRKDEMLSPFFADKSKTDWEDFLTVMCSFWENVLFYSGGYFGNPMQRHQEMNELLTFTEIHFTRWLELFCESIDQKYTGTNAGIMKERARQIATIMQVKLTQQSKAGS